MIRLPAEGRSARSSPPGGLPEGFDAITELVLVVVDVVTVIFAERGARENRARIRRSAVGPREGRRRRKNGFRPPARLTADDERPSYITRIVPAPLLQARKRVAERGPLPFISNASEDKHTSAHHCNTWSSLPTHSLAETPSSRGVI